MELTEKHLFIIATEVHGIREIEFKDKGRWDVPKAVLDACELREES